MKKIITILLLVLASRANAADGLFDFFKNKSTPPTSGKLLIFYRADCRYCENMSKVLEKEKGFVQLLEQHFNIQLMNIESEQGRLLADKFNVHAVPSVVKYESNTGDWFKIKGFPGITPLTNRP